MRYSFHARRIRIWAWLVAPIVMFSIGDAAEPVASAHVVKSDDIVAGRVVIVGKLGHPLNDELVTIRGGWIEGDRAKPSGPRFLVQEVDGEKRDPPITFYAYELRPAFDEDTRMEPVQGERWELRGLESGGYGELPPAAWEETNRFIRASRGSGFSTKFLYVKAQRLEKASKAKSGR